jgi:hypothetical protein
MRLRWVGRSPNFSPRAFFRLLGVAITMAGSCLIAALDPDRIEEGLACLEMSRDKVSRILGNPRAGFDQAEEWMNSDNPSLRRKAARVFADINDSSSRDRLDKLSQDSDAGVAAKARTLEKNLRSH